MNKIHSIHNKTKEIDIDSMPFNNKNILLYDNDLHALLINNNISLFRNIMSLSFIFCVSLPLHNKLV